MQRWGGDAPSGSCCEACSFSLRTFLRRSGLDQSIEQLQQLYVLGAGRHSAALLLLLHCCCCCSSSASVLSSVVTCHVRTHARSHTPGCRHLLSAHVTRVIVVFCCHHFCYYCCCCYCCSQPFTLGLHLVWLPSLWYSSGDSCRLQET